MFGAALISVATVLLPVSLATGNTDAVSAQSQTLAQPEVPTLMAAAQGSTWEDDASDLRESIDQDFVFECPTNGRIGEVWGSGIYTDGSSVCSAAVHAGLINVKDGGTVTIRMRSGLGSYDSSDRNGVSTSSYDSWPGSFIILNSSAPVDSDIGWEYGATELRGRLDQSFTFNCAPNGQINNVWGSDLYTDDSSVCSAAVHAGLITTQSGGPVSIRMIPGQGAYTSTSRNGVSTIGYGRWHGSYMFLR